jgi:hypothetical protein
MFASESRYFATLPVPNHTSAPPVQLTTLTVALATSEVSIFEFVDKEKKKRGRLTAQLQLAPTPTWHGSKRPVCPYDNPLKKSVSMAPQRLSSPAPRRPIHR